MCLGLQRTLLCNTWLPFPRVLSENSSWNGQTSDVFHCQWRQSFWHGARNLLFSQSVTGLTGEVAVIQRWQAFPRLSDIPRPLAAEDTFLLRWKHLEESPARFGSASWVPGKDHSALPALAPSRVTSTAITGACEHACPNPNKEKRNYINLQGRERHHFGDGWDPESCVCFRARF